MSDMYFKFLARDLRTVRIVCKSPECGVVVEVPTDRLDHDFKRINCPLCGEAVRREGAGDDALSLLGRAMRGLIEASSVGKIEVEFLVPTTNDTTWRR